MNFDESVKYLLSLGNEVLAMKLGLENISKLLHALGDPQNKYYKVQVAGTNGKGSACAFIEAICLSAGIRTGVSTSPHLVSITERVRINGVDISEKDFAKYATKIREVSEDLVNDGELESVPTYFEQVTAIGLHAFAEAGCELAVLETGLGGRFDAVTAARAEIAVITSIDYDHQDILGHTLAEIAAEKAAIIRPDSTVISAKQKNEAAHVIEQKAHQCNVAVETGIEVDFVDFDPLSRPIVNFQTARARYENVTLGLRGRHQVENAAVALMAAEALGSEFPINATEIVTGLEKALHPGRLEYRSGLPQNRSLILLDGAHNEGGARALAEHLEEYSSLPPLTLIFGAMRDKDLEAVTRLLFPKAEHIILTAADNPRALKPSEMRHLANGDSIHESRDVGEALYLAAEITPPWGLICVTGSLYLVGEVQKLLNNK